MGSKILNALKNDSLAVSFVYLKLRRECKQGYVKVGESRWGWDYRKVNKIMCFFESGYAFEGYDFWHFKVC